MDLKSNKYNKRISKSAFQIRKTKRFNLFPWGIPSKGNGVIIIKI